MTNFTPKAFRVGAKFRRLLPISLIFFLHIQHHAFAMQSPPPTVTFAGKSKADKLPPGSTLRSDPKDGTVTYLEGTDLSKELAGVEAFANLVHQKKYGEAALYFLQQYRSTFRLADPANELTVKSVQTDDLGYKHVRLSERVSGLPVWAAELIVHFNREDHIYLVSGRYMPTPAKVPKQPALSELEVKRQLSLKFAFTDQYNSSMVIFYDRIAAHLAYQVFISVSPAEAWEIIIDAMTGDVLQKLPRSYPK